MRVHSTTKSVDLRINKLTVASIRPGYIGQQAIADEITKRYNSSLRCWPRLGVPCSSLSRPSTAI